MRTTFYLAILLAGCSSPSSEPVPAPQQRGPAPVEPAPDEPEPTTFPDGFVGIWGRNEADCDATRSDTKGRLEVTPETLRFYESRATITDFVQRDERSLRVRLSFTGEGQTWSREMRLELGDDAKTLVREEYGDDAIEGTVRYTRCPG